MTAPLLRIDRVHKRFAAVHAVDDVSLDVRGGEIFALLGPNGAGKTTLIRMLMGLTRPDSGGIHFHLGGAAAAAPQPGELGYLPEDRGLYPDVQVLRTLVYFGVLRGMQRTSARVAAERWLGRMGLGDRATEPLKSLSKGNQQKVQFISSVLHAPRFAVLDEPFSGLDPLNQDLFLDLIRELRDAGTTILLSAHQMQLVERIADRVAVMNRGRVVLGGTIPEIRRTWTTGSRLRLRVVGEPAAGYALDLGGGVRAALVGPDEIEVLVEEGLPLGPVLAALGARFDVREIHSFPITLHDVYVRAVGAGAGVEEPEEVAA
jgi:ABC-2 type transport system ATP-binding protein